MSDCYTCALQWPRWIVLDSQELHWWRWTRTWCCWTLSKCRALLFGLAVSGNTAKRSRFENSVFLSKFGRLWGRYTSKTTLSEFTYRVCSPCCNVNDGVVTHSYEKKEKHNYRHLDIHLDTLKECVYSTILLLLTQINPGQSQRMPNNPQVCDQQSSCTVETPLDMIRSSS